MKILPVRSIEAELEENEGKENCDLYNCGPTAAKLVLLEWIVKVAREKTGRVSRIWKFQRGFQFFLPMASLHVETYCSGNEIYRKV